MKKVFIIIFCLLLTASLYSQEEYQLNNGFTVILQEDHKIPLATFQVWVKTGSIYEKSFGGSGISHYVEHLLFTDTKKQETEEIAKFMKKNGCDMNGYTSFERTVYLFTLPSENLFNIIPVVKEMIFDPAFKEDQVDKERNVILKEINMNIDDPYRFFSRLVFSSAYEESFYKYPVIGYRELFERITREDIIKYYNKMYISDNIALIVVGDFKKEELKGKIKEHFSPVKRKYINPVNILDEPLQTGYKEVTRYRTDIKIPRIALAWKTVDIRHKDIFALDVLSLILGRGKNSVLNFNLKEKNNFVSQINSHSYTPQKRGIFTIEAQPNPNVEPDLVKEKILDIMNKIDKYISADKLEKIKRIALKDYYKGKETINKKAGDIGINWSSTGNIFFSKYYVNGLRKVTRDEIIIAVKKYFNNDNLCFIKMLPKEFEKTKTSGPVIKEADKTVIDKLKSGLRIILNKNSNIPLINMSLVFKGGVLFEDPDKKGLTYFLSKMLISGTGKRSKEKIISAIEDRGGSITTFAGNNSFGLSIEVFKEDFSKCLDIVRDILLNSKFPEKEIKKTRIEIIQEIKARNEKIFGHGKKILFKEMFDNYGYSSLSTGSQESIEKIKKDDLISHFKKLVFPQNSVLSVSGDISEEKIKDSLDKTFKSWKKKGKELKENEFKPAKDIKKRKVEINVDKTQSLLLVSYYGISVRNNDRAKAELLWYILNGQGSRLFINLREKKELAYYAGMFPFYGLTTGLFVFYAGTVKDKLEKAGKGIQEEIDKIIADGIFEKELQGAKQEFLADKLKTFQANSSIAFEFALEELYNNRILFIQDHKKIVDNINLKDMNQFIRSYFADKPYKEIILKGK